MSDKSPDTHHSRTSLVQFNGTLVHFRGITQFVPSKVEGTITVISDKLGLIVQPMSVTVDNLCNHKKGTHLHQDIHTILGIQKCLPGRKTSGDVLGTRETNSGSSGEVASDGKHGDASVLDFLLPEVVECFFVSVCEESERIKEAKGWLDPKRLGEIHRGDPKEFLLGSSDTKSRRSRGLLGRSECSGRADKGSEDSNFHHGGLIF
mmetsp:Transcript_15008/g.27161  ORF Transcript_15008/g.27161 Transcript_15008/m.27161 type:complete len:206 (-) Transcript_15008:2-619(-)